MVPSWRNTLPTANAEHRQYVAFGTSMSLLSGLKFSKNSSTKASPASTADAPESTTQQTTLHRMIDYNQGAVGLSKATGGLRGVFIPNESQPSLSKREPCNSNNTSLKRPSDGKRMPIGRGMSDKQVT